jgi:hypothetical protein
VWVSQLCNDAVLTVLHRNQLFALLLSGVLSDSDSQVHQRANRQD